MNINGRVYTILFTFIYTFVFIFLLTCVYTLAKERIDSNQTLFQKKAILNAIGITTTSDAEVPELYSKLITIREKDNMIIYSAEVDGEKSHLLIFTGKALWGNVTGALSVNSEVSILRGVDIISHSETPGLGGRIEEKWFLDQFRNEKIAPQGISFEKGNGNYTPSDSAVDAITGATRTSESLQNMINETIKTFQDLKAGGDL